jgi:hypothetical protein
MRSVPRRDGNRPGGEWPGCGGEEKDDSSFIHRARRGRGRESGGSDPRRTAWASDPRMADWEGRGTETPAPRLLPKR